MQKRAIWSVCLTILLSAAILSACTSNAPAPQVTQAGGLPETPETQPGLPTPSPESTPTAQATATPAKPTSTPTSAPTATLPPQPVGPDSFPEGINPLTGLRVEDPELLDRRPMAIKIQLFPRGQRPAWGFSLADIVYEFYQNNGMTRLNAIFYGQDAEKVGPIRSARNFDGAIIRMYQAIFAFGGADARILTPMLNADYANRLVLEGANNCPPMCRIEPNTFNFLITNTAELSKYADAKGIPNEQPTLKGMAFDIEPPAGGTNVEGLELRYSISAYNRWDYDPDSGVYLRQQDNAEAADSQAEVFTPFIDRLNNQQAAAANVVVLFVPHGFAFKSGNSEIVDITLIGSGAGLALRDGKAYEVRWNRAAAADPLTLTTPANQPFRFKPGQTWFEIFGQTSTTDKTAERWRVSFSIP